MGRHIVFSSFVCPSVCLSVRHTFVSALYLLNPWWDLQITLHKCQVWWDDVQCRGLTKVSSRWRSQSKINIVWLNFVSTLYLLNPWWDFKITFHKCQVWWDDVQCFCLTKVGSRSRSEFKIKHCMTVFYVGSISRARCKTIVTPYIKRGSYNSFAPSPRYLLNPWLVLQITLHKCQEWWDDVQCLCLTNVCSRSRSQFKI